MAKRATAAIGNRMSTSQSRGAAVGPGFVEVGTKHRLGYPQGVLRINIYQRKI